MSAYVSNPNVSLLLGWLAAELHALSLRIGPAARGALQNTASLQLGGNTENRKHDLSTDVQNWTLSDIENWTPRVK